MDPTLIDGDMRYWRLKPAATLSGRVLCYGLVDPYAHRSFLKGTVPMSEQLLLPDGYSELVFRLSGRFERRSISGNEAVAVMQESYLIGGRSHSVITRNLSDVQLACIKLDSRFLRSIIGMPLSELRDVTVTLQDLNCPALLDLEDAFLNARSVEAAKKHFDTFFQNALRKNRGVDARVDELVRRIQMTHGALSIMNYARSVNVDARTLERKFIAEMGMAPKQYSSIVRFKRAYFHSVLSPSLSAAQAVHLEGYYDQSHFDRDFKKFLGHSPREKLEASAHLATSVSDHLLGGELAAIVNRCQPTPPNFYKTP